MKLILKTVSAASLAAVLGACAGGGAVHIPDSTATMPTVSPLNVSDVQPLQGSYTGHNFNAAQPVSSHSNPAVGTLKAVSLPKEVLLNVYNDRKNVFIYETADGKQYALLGTGNPFVPTAATSVSVAPPRVKMSETAAGDKFIVCCDQFYNSRFIPARVGDHDDGGVRYGVWISASGRVDMFYGGTPAVPAQMLGASGNGGVPRGKATYEVAAFRVRDGQAVMSTHDVANTANRSLLTVNFNSRKMGGTILGNAEFGDNIVFGDVSVDGASFSGSVTSAGVSGQVEGSFYGRNHTTGSYIGGRAVFNGRNDLDSVFGGSIRRQGQASYVGDDVNHLD
ncbi:transferrin-binding protein-like solute binding protein [Neisseria shayeganii]|uniref:Hemoglobin-haptoglobin-utilization protein n=1 Tax=Neisseria shayeganii 871 TaxID=1032488 RepID=G4CJC2_9NEIS|nr:transferrin-binding protein-like solute binding protein [Neisseria shayeganii]EGY52082.1 hemoglobin-haptoglobin-utilization protein [Neisseria shayeganii 871]